jgi:hypothetical protein
MPSDIPSPVVEPTRSIVSSRGSVAWVAIPFSLFLCVQCGVSWAWVYNRQLGLDHAFFYMLGGVIFGLLLSLPIAFIAYGLSRGSWRAATVAFGITILIFCLALLLESFSAAGAVLDGIIQNNS